MYSPKFTPWWKNVNDYLSFDERKEFAQGAGGLRPNLPLDVMMGVLNAGYVNNKFEKPQSHSGKSNEKNV